MKLLIKSFYLCLFIFIASALHAGAFSAGVYGNTEGWYEDQYSLSITTNADWKTTSVKGYFELKLSGKNISGFDFWSKLGANVDYYTSPLSADYTSYYFDTTGILNNLIAGQANNFQMRQFEAHIYKQMPFLAGKTGLTIFIGENRTELGQPYLDFFGDIGDGDTRAGFQWDAYGLWGFYTKGFVLDYRSTYKDTNSASDMWAYVSGIRIGRDLIKKKEFNWMFGVTAGFESYSKKYSISDLSGYTGEIAYTNRYYYNVIGADTTLNGDLKAIGSYYLFMGFGRSYAPEEYPSEYNSLIGFLGNTNSLIYSMEFKWNKKFETEKVDLGHLFLGLAMYGRQPRYQTYMGGSGDSKYQETITFTYNLPYKALTLNGRFEYYHNYNNYNSDQYHIWQAGTIVDESTALKDHIDLNVMFKSGFSFTVAYDVDYGKNYLGSFIPTGLSYLTITTAGETSLGRISPQFKIVGLGDTNKTLLSSGIELFLNFNSWFKFYSRFAYVQSAGFWKSGSDVNWWTAFVQFQFYGGDYTKIFLELGDSGQTSDGFVSDYDLIGGAKFRKKVYLKLEYWI